MRRSRDRFRFRDGIGDARVGQRCTIEYVSDVARVAVLNAMTVDSGLAKRVFADSLELENTEAEAVSQSCVRWNSNQPIDRNTIHQRENTRKEEKKMEEKFTRDSRCLAPVASVYFNATARTTPLVLFDATTALCHKTTCKPRGVSADYLKFKWRASGSDTPSA